MKLIQFPLFIGAVLISAIAFAQEPSQAEVEAHVAKKEAWLQSLADQETYLAETTLEGSIQSIVLNPYRTDTRRKQAIAEMVSLCGVGESQLGTGLTSSAENTETKEIEIVGDDGDAHLITASIVTVGVTLEINCGTETNTHVRKVNYQYSAELHGGKYRNPTVALAD